MDSLILVGLKKRPANSPVQYLREEKRREEKRREEKRREEKRREEKRREEKKNTWLLNTTWHSIIGSLLWWGLHLPHLYTYLAIQPIGWPECRGSDAQSYTGRLLIHPSLSVESLMLCVSFSLLLPPTDAFKLHIKKHFLTFTELFPSTFGSCKFLFIPMTLSRVSYHGNPNVTAVSILTV